MVLRLLCSDCGWSKYQEGNDSKGYMLEILKGIHEMTFKRPYLQDWRGHLGKTGPAPMAEAMVSRWEGAGPYRSFAIE